MEKCMDREQKILISNELTQGKELANQLRKHLNPSSSSIETRNLLIERILSSYEKAISVLTTHDEPNNKPIITESPPHSLANSSPRSEVSDQDSKDQLPQRKVSKKRKIQSKWTEQVKVCSGSGQEGPVDDGYNWRKYGQKDILGANFPRGYYRCTHRHSQGCLATKQVQKSDHDPSIFEVTYRGRHTCILSSHKSGAKDCCDNQKEIEEEEKPSPLKPFLFNFSADEEQELKVKTEDFLDTNGDIFPSFSFPCASIGDDNEGNSFFADPPAVAMMLGDLSPSFISPATSESNYFSCDISNFGMSYCVHTPESELTEIISASTSVTNSPIGDFDISLDNVDFDTNFPLSEIFS